MVSVIEAIREILRPGVFEDHALELRELDPGSSCPTIKLNKRGKALMIRPDQVQVSGMSAVDRLFPLFDTTRPGLCQLCDYLVFYSRPQPVGEPPELFVFLFELKSGSAKGAARQLRNGKLLADYVIEMAHLHGGGGQRPGIHYRGVTFASDAPRPRIVARPHKGFDWIADPRVPQLHTYNCRPFASHDLDMLCVSRLRLIPG